MRPGRGWPGNLAIDKFNAPALLSIVQYSRLRAVSSLMLRRMERSMRRTAAETKKGKPYAEQDLILDSHRFYLNIVTLAGATSFRIPV